MTDPAAAAATASTTITATHTHGGGWHHHHHGGKHKLLGGLLAAGVGLLAGAGLIAFIKHKHDQHHQHMKQHRNGKKCGGHHHHHHHHRHWRHHWGRHHWPWASSSSSSDDSSSSSSSSDDDDDHSCHHRRRHNRHGSGGHKAEGKHCDAKKGAGACHAGHHHHPAASSAAAADTKTAAASTWPDTPADAPIPSGGIVVVGSVNADVFLDVQALPAEGETISATVDNDYIKPGGKGANQAVAARRLSPAPAADSKSSPVSFVGRFGNDGHGPWARSQMSDGYGVDCTLSSRASVPMGQAYIFLNSSGANSIVLIGAANHAWPDTLSDKQLQLIKSAKLVLLQREIPDRVNVNVARVAHSAGVRVCLDVGGIDAPLADDILPYLYVLAPNETELARLTKLPTETDAEITTAAHVLLKRGVKNVLVTLGTRGSLLFASTTEAPLHQACLPAPKVVDTTGAGDCFRAAFAVALTEGKGLQESMRFAAGAAALCVGVKGAMPSMPTRKDTLAFLDAQSTAKSSGAAATDNKDQKHSAK